MVAKVAPDMKQFTTQVPAKLYEAFEELVRRLGRPFAREVAEAFRRHLENPPRLVEEPHPDCTTADAAPARKPGRPPSRAIAPEAAPAPAKPGRSSAYEEALAKQQANRPAARPQKPAERRTQARADLAALDGLERVGLHDERPAHAPDEGRTENAD